MTVAANEWGHSLWISEEIFSVPFHWPFVVYGWLASGMFAVWGETIIRLFEIEKAEEAATSGTSALVASAGSHGLRENGEWRMENENEGEAV